MADGASTPEALAARSGLRVTRAEGLHQGTVAGRRWAWNPLGWEAVAVLSDTAAALLDAADGRTLGDVARDLGRPPEQLAAELPLLARNGFVTGEGLPPMRAPPASPPKVDLWVHVTNACDLDCPHCYIEKDGRSLSDDTARALLDALVATARGGARAVHLRFAGGEPMLRFDLVRRLFDDAREALSREGCALTAAVLTNGTRAPDHALAWMRDRGVGVSVSLDGVGAVHDAMRPRVGGGGSFEEVSRQVERYLEAGMRPHALVTVSRDNLEGMPALTDWLVARGLSFRYSLVRDLEGGASLLSHRSAGWRAMPGLVQLRRRAAQEALQGRRLEGEDLARVTSVFAECYARIEGAMPVRPSFRKTHRFCDLEWRRPIRKACGAGEASLAVGYDGRLSPCQAALHEPDAPALDPARSLRAQARALPQFGGLRREAPDAACAACSIRHACAGGCPLLLHRRDGHARGSSPYCEVFRDVLPRVVRLVALELALEQRHHQSSRTSR